MKLLHEDGPSHLGHGADHVKACFDDVKDILQRDPCACLDAPTTLRLCLAASILDASNKKMLDLLFEAVIGELEPNWRTKVQDLLKEHGRIT